MADNLDAIQAALKAVGDTSDDSGLEPLQDDRAIRDALEAATKPVKELHAIQQTPPPSGMVDWGGMPAHALGGLVGAYNTVAQVPGMVIGGLASGPAAALHAIFGDSMPTGGEALEEGEDLFQIHPSGEVGRGAQAAQDTLAYPFTKGSELGGAAFAGLVRGEHKLAGDKLTPGQQAQEEAVTRTYGEAVTNALMALAGGKAGADVPLTSEVPQGIESAPDVPRGTPETPPLASTDFSQRMAEAAPKPVTPEAPAPARVQADIAALEAPYRYAPDKDAYSSLPKLPKWLSGAKPKIGEQRIEFASDLDRAAYIVANPRSRSSAHADYLDWLAKSLDTDENTALTLAKRSKEATVAAVKAGNPKIEPYLRPKQGEPVLPPQPAPAHAPEAQVRASEEPLQALDKALQRTSLTRTPVPPGSRGLFAQENHLRMGQGQGEPLPYIQLVRDVFPTPADEVINTIGERVFQEGKGDPTRVHLPPDDLKALEKALAQKGWPIHRRDVLEKLSAALAYALDNRQLRNEGYAPMRGAIQDHNLTGDVLRNPENYAVTARLKEFKPPRDFEKVCV